jgi:50S ribosome-binding GTPase
MRENNQEPPIEYKIGIIGPSGVGKTSMISALLEQGQELLARTPVSIEAVGETKDRISKNRDKLRGSIMAGEFNPGAMSGTEDPSEIILEMSVGQSKLTWAILDYPGKFISEKLRDPNQENQWKYCQEWIKESIVLLVPIDAAVVMESTTKAELEAANMTLQISKAEFLARQWAKGRMVKKEPGLLILVPVKCETYFSDNGGSNDTSEDLFKRIHELYQSLLDYVCQEISCPENKPKILIQYHPIDTIGCVEIKSAKWLRNDEAKPSVFDADYLVRPPRKRCPKGADGLLISICSQIANLEKNKKRGFWIRLWRWLTEEDKQLNEAIDKLQKQPPGQRVRHL